MTEFKRGEIVEVQSFFSSSDKDEWESRIYLETIEGAGAPYICVAFGDEEAFKEGRPFDTTAWNYCRKKRPNLKIDDPVLVWEDCQSDSPKRRHFKKWTEDGKIICWADGKTSWSVDWSNDDIVWDNYEIPDKKEK